MYTVFQREAQTSQLLGNIQRLRMVVIETSDSRMKVDLNHYLSLFFKQ